MKTKIRTMMKTNTASAVARRRRRRILHRNHEMETVSTTQRPSWDYDMYGDGQHHLTNISSCSSSCSYSDETYTSSNNPRRYIQNNKIRIRQKDEEVRTQTQTQTCRRRIVTRKRVRKNNRTWAERLVVFAIAAATATTLVMKLLQVQEEDKITMTIQATRTLLPLFVEGSTTITTTMNPYDDDDDNNNTFEEERYVNDNVSRRPHHRRAKSGGVRGSGDGGKGNAINDDGGVNAVDDEDVSLHHTRQNQQLNDWFDTYYDGDEMYGQEDYYYHHNNYYSYDGDGDSNGDDNTSSKKMFQQEISGDDGTTIEDGSSSSTSSTSSKEWQELLSSQIPQLPHDLFARPPSSQQRRRSLLTWGQTGPNTYQISFGGGAVISTPDDRDDYGIGGGSSNNDHPSTRKHSKKSKKGGGSNYGSDKRKPTRRPTRAPTRRPTRSPTRPPQRVPTSPPIYDGGGGPTAAPTDRRPVLPPIISQPIHPPIEPPSSTGGFCAAPIKLDFLQFTSIPPPIVPFPTDPNPQDLGTRYIYSNALKDETTLDNLPGSMSRGTCTRTQARIVHSNNNVVQLGGGVCDFTYTFTLSEGTTKNNNQEPRVFSITVSGYIEDAAGGTLSITGGTADAIGAFGQVQLLPVNLGPNNSGGDPTFVHEDGDVFVDPFFYLAELTLFLPCSN